jgi:hypothetical protein
MATFFSHANLIAIMENRKGGIVNPFSVLTFYQSSFIFLEGLLVIANIAGGIASRAYRKYFRTFSMACSLALATIACVEFGLVNDKTRSVNLKFTSNLFLNLYKSALYYPGKTANPKLIFGICAVTGLMGLTHLALVGARYKTDNDDNVTFSFV